MKINQHHITGVSKVIFCLLLLLMAFCCGYAQCNTGVNIALGKTVVASSLESVAFPAGNAVDGNTGSRWSSAYTDNEYLYIDLGSSYPLCQVVLNWEAAYGKNFTIDISANAITWTTAATITGNTLLTNTISVSGSGRYVRMKGTLRGTGFGYSLYEFQVFSSNGSLSCPTSNIALNKSSFISSLESVAFPALNAFDGNPATRWSSGFTDPQYIYVDLGTPYVLCSVELTWENAYGKNFTIDGSNNAITWTTLSSTTNNTSMYNAIPVSGSWRYVRMNGTARATGYGFSLYEFAVHGSATLPITISAFSATETAQGTVALSWNSSGEDPGVSFMVQRSSDAIRFDSVGTVKPGGNAYRFNDEVPGAGSYFYRLKQTDANGLVSFSPIEQVNISSNSPATVFLSPNPAGNWFTLKGRGINEKADIRICDLAGNLVKRLSQVRPAEPVPVTDLPPGLYFVSISTVNRSNTLKLIKR